MSWPGRWSGSSRMSRVVGWPCRICQLIIWLLVGRCRGGRGRSRYGKTRKSHRSHQNNCKCQDFLSHSGTNTPQASHGTPFPKNMFWLVSNPRWERVTRTISSVIISARRKLIRKRSLICRSKILWKGSFCRKWPKLKVRRIQDRRRGDILLQKKRICQIKWLRKYRKFNSVVN